MIKTIFTIVVLILIFKLGEGFITTASDHGLKQAVTNIWEGDNNEDIQK
jgi:hypothetical protein